MIRNRSLLVIAFLVLSLVVAACSSAGPAPQQAGSQPAESKSAQQPAAEAKPPVQSAGESKPAAAKNDTPIKIGLLLPMTGAYGSLGPSSEHAFRLYLSQTGNKLGGRPVEILVEDTETKPDAALTKAKKLVERDNVQMLVGGIHSGVVYAVAEYANAKKIPFLHLAGADDLTQRQFSRYVFRAAYGNSQMVHPLGEWAYKQGLRKATVVGSDYAAGYEYVGGFARAFTQAGGTVIQELYPPLGAPDMAPFVTAIKPEADVVFAFVVGPDAVRFIKDFDEYGVKKRSRLVTHFGAVTDNDLATHGDHALGIVSARHWTKFLDTPAAKAFTTAFKTAYPNDTGEGEMAYMAAAILDRAFAAIGGKVEDTEALIGALEKTNIPDSPRGPMKYDEKHGMVMNIYLTEVKKAADGSLVNQVIETYKDVSEYWKWSLDEYLKMPAYTDLKGKWAK